MIEFKRVKDVSCTVSPSEFIYCEVYTFDGREESIDNLEEVYFGDARGKINFKGEMKFNFARKDNATCEKFGGALRCRRI